MKLKKVYPLKMVVMAFVLLGVDSGISSGSIYDRLAVNGETGQALALTLVFAVVIFAISINAFLKGLELAAQPHSAKRTANLSILTLAVAFLMVISVLMNSWFIGGDSMSKEWVGNFIEEVINDGVKVNNLYTYAEDEKITLKTIQETSQKWLSCERSSGCLGKQGAGSGQTTLVLSSNLSVAQKALDQILELSNEYEPIIKRAKEISIRLDFIPEMKHLSFNEKLKKAEEEISNLSSTFKELQGMLPIRTFETLTDAYDTTVNQYIAQGISPVGARTLFNYYNKHSKRYESITRMLKRGKLMQIKSMYKPTDWEIMTSSSNGLFIWLMSIVIACFGWLMLGIHIIQNTESSSEDEDNESSPLGSQRQLNKSNNETGSETVAVLHAASSTTKH